MSIKKQIFTSHLRAKPDFMLYNREAPKNFGGERVDSKRLKKGCAKAKNRSVRQAWVQRTRGWTRRQRAQQSSNGCGSRCSHVAVDKKPPRRHAPLRGRTAGDVREGGERIRRGGLRAVNSAPRITTETEDGKQRGYKDPSYKSDWNVLNSAPWRLTRFAHK